MDGIKGQGLSLLLIIIVSLILMLWINDDKEEASLHSCSQLNETSLDMSTRQLDFVSGAMQV